MSRQRTHRGKSTVPIVSTSWENGPVRILVSPGIEDLLADEMESLGIDGHPVIGGYEAVVTHSELSLIHLHSRLASKVMFEVGSSGAGSLEALAQGVRKVAWSRFLKTVQGLKIQIELKGSRLKQKSAIEKKIRWSIGDALSKGTKSAHSSGRSASRGPPQRPQELFVRVKGQRAWFSLNASGEHLFRRGWRTHVSQAPIRENLAAAMLAFAEWSPGEPLVDPLCGSGTIPIEAGCIAHGIAPGLNRRFAFEHWPCHMPEQLASLRADARAARRSVEGLILGGDIHSKAIEASIHNVGLAGLTDEVFFQSSPFKALQSPGQPGLVLTNPPYGRRLSDAHRVGDLYGHLGRVLKTSWVGWRVGVLVPDLRLRQRLDLSLEPVASFQNGGIPIWLLLGSV